MNESDMNTSLRDYAPAWTTDGLGIRGVPTRVQSFGSAVEFPHARIDQTTQPCNESILGPGWQSPAGGGNTAPSIFQYITIARLNGSSWEWGVVYNSELYGSSGKMSDTISISGLLAPDLSSGWLALNVSADVMYLEGVTTDLSTPPTVTAKAAGSAALPQGGTVQYAITGSGPTATYAQTFFRLPIAKSTADGNGNPVINQLHTGALILDIDTRLGNDSTGSNPLQTNCQFPFPL